MTVIEYLIKLSLSLAILYTFYRLVLRGMTFYQWNRFFLLAYSLLAFVLPFMDVASWINTGRLERVGLVEKIPVMEKYTREIGLFSGMDWAGMVFLMGVLVMCARVLLQYLSLRRIRAAAALMYADQHVKLFATSEKITPFSFGKAIYVNSELHSEVELERIIQHEIVHVKQQHTIDLLAGELLCVVNWFNPFAWLIRNAIRQNLEFIADRNVISQGHDKKEYQYLLLKVVGVPQFSIANNFNLLNLKKRIVMMNKMKTATIHLAKFLFVLPLLLLVLLAFRSEQQKKALDKKLPAGIILSQDTVPEPVEVDNKIGILEPPMPQVNEKGYMVTVASDNDESVVLIRDKNRRMVKAMPLTEWNSNRSKNERKYGKILPPPPPSPAPPQPPVPPISSDHPPVPPVPPVPPEKDEKISIRASRIEIRMDTLNQEQPVYILDNQEVTAEVVQKVSPVKIKYVNVTKGKEAVHQYGTRGKNGVVEIKTVDSIK